MSCTAARCLGQLPSIPGGAGTTLPGDPRDLLTWMAGGWRLEVGGEGLVVQGREWPLLACLPGRRHSPAARPQACSGCCTHVHRSLFKATARRWQKPSSVVQRMDRAVAGDRVLRYSLDSTETFCSSLQNGTPPRRSPERSCCEQ